MHERVPWDAQIDLAPIVAAAIPALVISGGHDPMHEAVADGVTTALGPATQRLEIPGGGHVVQRTGAPFNAALETFFRTASGARRPE